MPRPKSAKPRVGDVRWVHFDPDGSETDFDAEPQDVKTLRVEIISVSRAFVVEATLTTNQKFAAKGSMCRAWQACLPENTRGAGWVIFDHYDGAGSTCWTRRRAI